jgi:asparagine synthase (glutamine-hydrolysing)
MGALFFVINNYEDSPINVSFINGFMNMKNRGKDDTNTMNETTPNITHLNINQAMLTLSKRELREYRPYTFTYGFHRMCINDLSYDGSQPFEDPILHKIREYPELKTRVRRRLMCTGEIYNYEQLRSDEKFTNKDLQSTSDVEIILPLYIKYGLEQCLNKINGEYSFILTENTNTYDVKTINIYAVRDMFGIKPLYMIKRNNNGGIFYMFVSELKGLPSSILNNHEYVIKEVPPGTYWSFKNSVILGNNGDENEFIRYYSFDKFRSLDACIYNKATPEVLSDVYNKIRESLTDSVIKRYELSKQKVGFLLSGFDSAIILCIVIKYLQKSGYDFEGNPIRVFTFGDNESKDVISARECISFLETTYSIDIHHHIINVHNVNIILSDIRDIIYTLETSDRRTIRQSIVYAFLCKYISQHTDIKVILTGEGLDELCGYEQLFNLDDSKFQEKSVDLLNNIGKFNVTARDKIAGFYNMEARHPFLDKDFVELMLSIHPILKRPQKYDYSKGAIEKYIVRKAFDDSIVGSNFYINKTLLWKKSGCISNSTRYIKSELDKYFSEMYSDPEFYDYIQMTRQNVNIVNYPKTKEDMYYQKTYDLYFPNTSNIIDKTWDNIWEN